MEKNDKIVMWFNGTALVVGVISVIRSADRGIATLLLLCLLVLIQIHIELRIQR